MKRTIALAFITFSFFVTVADNIYTSLDGQHKLIIQSLTVSSLKATYINENTLETCTYNLVAGTTEKTQGAQPFKSLSIPEVPYIIDGYGTQQPIQGYARLYQFSSSISIISSGDYANYIFGNSRIDFYPKEAISNSDTSNKAPRTTSSDTYYRAPQNYTPAQPQSYDLPNISTAFKYSNGGISYSFSTSGTVSKHNARYRANGMKIEGSDQYKNGTYSIKSDPYYNNKYYVNVIIRWDNGSTSKGSITYNSNGRAKIHIDGYVYDEL